MTTRKPPIFSEEQRSVIDTWGQGVAVLAGAGSGKTTTLVEKCLELIRRNPEARFVAVSFTEKSASDLKTRLAMQTPLGPHWVMTIHGLCGSILRENPPTPRFGDQERKLDGQESILSETEASLLWERALENLWSENLAPEIQASVEKLLDRENWDSLKGLLRRLKDLGSFGALGKLEQAPDSESQALAQVARFVFDRYERLKMRQGALDFNDLEIGARQALENRAVCEAYQKRFDLVLIDEFQDTNPVQAEILTRFARPDFSNLCVVGDPKQSIYRFRDADVSVFEEFCRKLPVQLALHKNFRSRPGILDFTNQICSRAFEVAGMTYLPLTPAREAVAEMPPVIKLQATEPRALAAWILGEVKKGIPLDRMALLLRRIRGNEDWIKEIAAAGVPVAVGSGGLFWQDPRVRELVALLKWWDNKSNTLSAAIFLRAPWVGIPDETLDQWIASDLRTGFFSSKHPLALALKKIREKKSVRPAEVLEAVLTSPEVEDELGTAWLGLWHRCEELASAGQDFHQTVMDLSSAVEGKPRDRDVPPPKNLGQLSVLTLHGAKGLEFEHVILIDLPEKAQRTTRAPLLFWDREAGIYLGKRNEEGDRDKENPEEARWRRLEQDKNLAESMRLFYVALTRAQERLVLVYPNLPEEDRNSRNAPDPVNVDDVFRKDFWRGWIERATEVTHPLAAEILIPGEFAQVTQQGVEKPELSHPSQQTPQVVGLKRARHSVTEWLNLARCARLYEWSYVRPPQGSSDERSVDQVELLSADGDAPISQRELGTRVHACLENVDEAALRGLEKDVNDERRFSAQKVLEWAKSSTLMKTADADRDVWSELSFEIPVAGQILVGSIDRLVEERSDEGRILRLVDFKVTERPRSSEELLASYQSQMDLYAWAISQIEGDSALLSEGRLRGYLVNISGAQVAEYEVPLGGAFDAEKLAALADRIVNGQAGKPQPSKHCEKCSFRGRCPEGQRGTQKNLDLF